MKIAAIMTEGDVAVFLLRAIIRGHSLLVVEQLRDDNDLADDVIDIAEALRNFGTTYSADSENKSV